jgi:hypothetical protein
MRYEVLKAVNVKIAVLWNLTQCSLKLMFRRCLLPPFLGWSMKATGRYETSAPPYETKRPLLPDYLDLSS